MIYRFPVLEITRSMVDYLLAILAHLHCYEPESFQRNTNLVDPVRQIIETLRVNSDLKGDVASRRAKHRCPKSVLTPIKSGS